MKDKNRCFAVWNVELAFKLANRYIWLLSDATVVAANYKEKKRLNAPKAQSDKVLV